MKKVFLFMAALIVSIGFMAVSATNTTAASSGDVIELQMADWDPPAAPICKTTQAWADMINKLTNGKVKITVYFGGTLLKFSEVYRGIQTGMVDIGYYVVGTDPGLIPLNEVVTLPFLGFSSREQLNTIYGKLMGDSRISGEFKGVKVLGWNAMPGSQLHLTKKAVHVPADLKGLKVIASGRTAEYARANGASPVNLGVGDWASSLQKNLVEGQFVHFPAAMALRTLELFTNHTVYGDSGVGMGLDMYIINQKLWDSFTPDIQKAFNEATAWRQQEMLKVDSGQIQAALNYCNTHKQVIYTPTAAEMTLWKASAKPLAEKWIADMDAKGLAGQAVYDEVQQLIKETK
jgi:TRAP-type C4-dicarboxylate transport system substrate-binding protein